MIQEYAPLHRTFVHATEHGRDPSVWGQLRELASAITWPSLLKYSCVVVLGEAGIGKTSEFRAQAAALAESGEAAFFLPVETLTAQGVEKALARDPSFPAWRDTSDGEAWFFLDAVDESVLRGRKLDQALNNVCHELSSHLSRMRLVISSRASDWRSSDDAELRSVSKLLASPSTSDDKRFALVQLASLNETQIKALCVHEGMVDVEGFLYAVRDANAWSFLERPLDVQWLGQYWTEHGRLGSLRELVQFNIDQRLKERPDRPTLISPEKALDGVATLSLAAALSRRSAFLLPGEDADPRAEDALDPRDVLKDWTNEEIRDLLARGLFDEATYGRVRIHHRSVHEFLAAQRLAQMLRDGYQRTDLNSLFFRQSSGYTVVPSHLTAILAWLALLDPEIRRLATRHAPEHLVDEGDPSRIPADERRNILRAYIERFGDRKRVFHHLDSIGLKRFACVELAETIRAILIAPGEPDHIRELLLRLITEGRIATLVNDALQVALDPATPAGVRLEAIRAVCAQGVEPARADLRRLLGTPAVQAPEIAAALLDELFPTVLGAPEVVTLLNQVVRPRRISVTTLDMLVPRLAEKCSPEARRELLRGLVPILGTLDSATGKPKLNPNGVWLAECIIELLSAISEDGGEYPESVPEVLELLQDAAYHPEYSSTRGFADVLKKHPEHRRRLFWHAVDALQSKQGKRARSYWDVAAGRGRVGIEDLPWLWEDAKTKPHVRDRVLAFDCIWHVVHGGVEDPGKRSSLLSGIANEVDAMHGDGALGRKLRRKLNPRHFVEIEAIVRMNLQSRARNLRKSRIVEENRRVLNEELPQITDGTHHGALLHLFGGYHLGQEKGPAFTRITEEYGPQVAEAARSGLKAFWRANEPPKINDFEQGQIPTMGEIGLLGMEVDVADGLDVANLSEDLRRAAIGYAIWELNRFPAWFEDAVRGHELLAAEVLREVMQRDYVSTDLGRVIHKLSLASKTIRRACSPILSSLLQESDPPDVQVLKGVLEALDGTEVLFRTEMAALAEARCNASLDEPKRFAVWWCQWLAADSVAALDALENALTTHAAPRDLAEEVFSRLWAVAEPRSGERRIDLRSERALLVRLIPIVHTYIRTENDIHHDGAYTVGRRDHCQDLRRSLVAWLGVIEGAETVEALQRFAGESWFEDQAEWIKHLAEHRAVEDGARALSVEEAVALVYSLVLQPRTSADLFDIALSRLEDIRLYLADGEFSVRSLYNPKEGHILEEPVQNLLAQQLEEGRRTQYTVSREPEVTRKKKPDIRLAHPSCEGPVTIEIKIAERWTIAQLEAAIRDQLIGQYMRDNNSRYGVLVLCSSGPPKPWKHATSGQTFGFAELLEHLCRFAEDLVRHRLTVSGLRVVAIDFH